jgi:SAM-dependent methyltransferase
VAAGPPDEPIGRRGSLRQGRTEPSLEKAPYTLVRVSAGRGTSSGEYLLDNRAGDAGQRFAALSALFDPVTFRHVTALGIAPGWRCWEVGAGGPSVPSWLADRIAPDGHVVATDIEPSGITAPDGARIEVRRHDVAHDEPPEDGFDLVHARLVLVHVPDRDEAIRRMAASLRPGGHLLIEDFDVALQPLACPAAYGPDQELANRIRAGFVALLAQRGVDLEYGRKLPRLLRALGLADVAADAYFPVALAAGAALDAANVTQVRDGLMAQGHATDEEIEGHLAALTEEGRLDVAVPPLVSAWGRR